MKTLLISSAIISIACVVLATIALMGGHPHGAGYLAILACVSAAIFFQRTQNLKTFAFSFSVLAFVVASLIHPGAFLSVQGFDQRKLIVPLIQIIMFGMGATLSLADFAAAVKNPRAVTLGILLQFSVMPLLGWLLATVGGFEPEVAAGVILIGACPGGVASNVMTYLAKGNVALSVTMTACSTMLAPVATPLAMKVLAGRLIAIDVWDMLLSIVNMIIVPVVAGLITHYLLNSRLHWKTWRPAAFFAGILIVIITRSAENGGQYGYSIGGALILMACVRQKWLATGLPLISMAGICYIVAIITANSRERLLQIGIGLLVAGLVHNLCGYVFGYLGARAARLSQSDSRTVAIEVGLQNGGMGAALAIDVLKSSSAALGSVIFGVWMNVSGSILASWWRGRPLTDEVAPRAGQLQNHG
jgi:BASS family bile acid:Na+ symporter